MKSKKIIVASAIVFALTSLNAASGVFDFETLDGSAKSFIEGSGNGNTSTQGTPSWSMPKSGIMEWSTYSTSGSYGYLSSGNYFGGVVSNSQANDGKNYGKDLNSIAGGGSEGSSNFGVMMLYDMMGGGYSVKSSTVNGMTFNSLYAASITDVESFSFITEDALNFTSIDLCLNVYTYDNLLNGDGMAKENGVQKTILNTPESAYIIRIYGVNEKLQIMSDNYVDHILAYNYADEVYIQNDWQTVSLLGLNNGETIYGLAFEALTSFGNSWGPTTAAMIAIDNITYGTAAVPEPAEWATILGFVSLVFVVVKRKRR